MDPAVRDAIARCARAAAGLDAQSADRHSLLPYLTPVPEQWRQSWARASLLFATETARLAGLFSAAGIAMMPLKGPVLAAMLSGDPAGRQYGDLDLMVEPDRAGDAIALLRSAGYEPKWTGRAASHHARFNWYGETSLRHARHGFDADLHWTFTPSHYVARMDDRAVWTRARQFDFLGCAVRVPAPEDYFEYLCLHAARHEWSRWGWLADLAVFRAKYVDDLDFAALARRPDSGWLIVETLRRVAAWLREPAPDLLAAPPRWPRRLRYHAAVALIPTEADWTAVDLPPGLAWLYYPYRAGRLLARRFTRRER